MAVTDPPRPRPAQSPEAAARWNPAQVLARLRASGPVLVCAFDGVSLSGAIASRDGNSCKLSTVAVSRAADPATAVREVLDALARNGTVVPREVCLATPQAAPAFLDIGVDPARPRPAQEMRELIRWDMEAELANSTSGWTLTGVLILRGDLTNAQGTDLLAEAAMEGLQGANALNRRAADIAVEKGLLSTDALAAASSQFVRLAAGDEDTMCAWAAPVKKSSGIGAWFCASTGASAREEWRTAFAETGHRLAWIYPLISAASLARLPHGGTARELVLEVHPSQLALVSLYNGRIVNLQLTSLRSTEVKQAAAEFVAKAAGFRPDRIAVLGPEGPAAAIAQELASSWSTLSGQGEPLAGIAAHALGLIAAAATPRIAAADPPPPPWRNPDVVRISAFCLVLLTLAGVTLGMHLRIAAAQNHLAQIERETEEMLKRDREAQAEATVVTAKQAEKQAASADLAQVKEDMRVIRDVLAVREKMIPGLVGALQRAVNEDVFLNSVTETGLTTATFEVRGWGMTDTAIQLFTKKLGDEIAPLELQISDAEEMRRGRDRLDLDGYLFSVRLIRAAEGTTQKGALAQPSASATPRPAARRRK